MDNEQVTEVLVAKQLTLWERCKRPCITLDADTFSRYFSFLEPKHTIHNQKTGDPLFMMFDKEYAVKTVKAHYRMHRGSL